MVVDWSLLFDSTCTIKPKLPLSDGVRRGQSASRPTASSVHVGGYYGADLVMNNTWDHWRESVCQTTLCWAVSKKNRSSSYRPNTKELVEYGCWIFRLLALCPLQPSTHTVVQTPLPNQHSQKLPGGICWLFDMSHSLGPRRGGSPRWPAARHHLSRSTPVQPLWMIMSLCCW